MNKFNVSAIRTCEKNSIKCTTEHLDKAANIGNTRRHTECLHPDRCTPVSISSFVLMDAVLGMSENSIMFWVRQGLGLIRNTGL